MTWSLPMLWLEPINPGPIEPADQPQGLAANYSLLPPGLICRCLGLAIDVRGKFWCCNDPKTRVTAPLAPLAPQLGSGQRVVGSGDVVALHIPRMDAEQQDGHETEASKSAV